jgi:translation initiation factor 6
MASRLKFENSNEIGCFMKMTNSYCLVSEGGSEQFFQMVHNEVGKQIPVINATIAGTKIVGRMTAGNKNGLLVPTSCTDDEMDAIKKYLPNGVKITKVEEKLSALGNCISCNDKVALIHPELDKDSEDLIAEFLDVEVYRTTIAGNPLVGTYSVLSNSGGLTHPMCGVAELDELSTLLQIPLCAGTVNRGIDVIGSGMVANDFSAFCGMETTATELSVIDAIFKLGDKTEDVFASESRKNLIDELT